MRLDDVPSVWQGGQGGRPPAPPARPPVQRGQPTGGLSQGAPLHQDELPAWLRVGSPHDQGGPNGAPGFGSQAPAGDGWDALEEWGAQGFDQGTPGYADFPDDYADPGFADQRGNGGDYRANPAGGRRIPGSRSQPDQPEKRGWRRIFGRK